MGIVVDSRGRTEDREHPLYLDTRDKEGYLSQEITMFALSIRATQDTGGMTVELVGEIDMSNVDLLREDGRHEVPGTADQQSLWQLAARHKLEIDTSRLTFISGDGFRALCQLDAIARNADFGGITIRQPNQTLRTIAAIVARDWPDLPLPVLVG